MAANTGDRTKPVPPPPPEVLSAQIIGIGELGPFLGFRKITTYGWNSRGGILPPPDYPTVNGHAAWRRLTIVKWAAETGRLPAWLTHEGERYSPDGVRRRHVRPTAPAGS